MKAEFRWRIATAVLAVLAPTAVLLAVPSNTTETTATSSDDAGVCPHLGCGGGQAKCASGTLSMPGYTVYYTCYGTVVHDE